MEKSPWGWGWGSVAGVGGLAAVCFSFLAGMQVQAAVMENRVANLESRQREVIESLSKVTERMNDLVDILWHDREDKLKEKEMEKWKN